MGSSFSCDRKLDASGVLHMFRMRLRYCTFIRMSDVIKPRRLFSWRLFVDKCTQVTRVLSSSPSIDRQSIFKRVQIHQNVRTQMCAVLKASCFISKVFETKFGLPRCPVVMWVTAVTSQPLHSITGRFGSACGQSGFLLTVPLHAQPERERASKYPNRKVAS